MSRAIGPSHLIRHPSKNPFKAPFKNQFFDIRYPYPQSGALTTGSEKRVPQVSSMGVATYSFIQHFNNAKANNHELK